MILYFLGTVIVATIILKKLWSNRNPNRLKEKGTQTPLLRVSDKAIQTDNAEQIIPRYYETVSPTHFDPRDVMRDDSPETNKSARKYRDSMSRSPSLQFEFSQ
jgi:hypothetical protein